MQVGTQILKLKKHVFAISLGAAMLAAMVVALSMMGATKAPTVANSGSYGAPVILASAHSGAAPDVAAPAATQPQSIPVPCPIWILSKLAGYGKTASQSTDGAASGPELVPGGIWLMQKFADAARKTL